MNTRFNSGNDVLITGNDLIKLYEVQGEKCYDDEQNLNKCKHNISKHLCHRQFWHFFADNHRWL